MTKTKLTFKRLDALEEQASLDAHYARSPAAREESFQMVELIRLARIGLTKATTSVAPELAVTEDEDAEPQSVFIGEELYDVVVDPTPAMNNAHAVRLVGPASTINLGFVMFTESGIVPAWWALGYVPVNPEKRWDNHLKKEFVKPETTRGLATRHDAIQHMLRRCGYAD